MNIKKPKVQKIVNLNESETPKPKNIVTEINNDLVELVFKTKSKQFQFDCGVIMGSIKIPLNNRFGLKWHFDKSSSVEQFIQSVTEFISASDNTLTENDISMLTKQYNRQKAKTV
jgi:predicted AAA+ superfamily ATPase